MGTGMGTGTASGTGTGMGMAMEMETATATRIVLAVRAAIPLIIMAQVRVDTHSRLYLPPQARVRVLGAVPSGSRA